MTLPASVLPPKLQTYLTAGDCVAFVGAGFSMACGMPGWRELLLELIDDASNAVMSNDKVSRLRSCRVALDDGEFQRAATMIKDLLSREEIWRTVKRAFDRRRLYQSPKAQRVGMRSRLENLVRGPWVGIITTNFDNLIDDAYVEFRSTTSPFKCDATESLGNVLCLPMDAGGFFVKLHGSTMKPVLSTNDYIETWLSTPRVRYFLIAVMLRYRLVFIGCSLEDEILRIRKELWSHFEKQLPLCYALLPATKTNLSRADELLSATGIESLLYSTGPAANEHSAVDHFLNESRLCADFRFAESSAGTLASLKARSVSERYQAIGSINRELLEFIARQDRSRLAHKYVFDPYFDHVPGQDDSRHAFSSISVGERLYRLLFLVSLELIAENVDEEDSWFQVNPEVLNIAPMKAGARATRRK